MRKKQNMHTVEKMEEFGEERNAKELVTLVTKLRVREKKRDTRVSRKFTRNQASIKSAHY